MCVNLFYENIIITIIFFVFFNARYCYGNSVHLSVCLSNSCIVTKRNNRLSVYQHRMREQCF